ncbi:endonuclease/exonuclease/phosphatase family protein [Nakamurella silvestris]|nr:endonuclease/exonuclease/phosphatase family protein [Nakamurella silvestris]
MRVLSLNVWGGTLHDELLDYLKAVDADAYCLQEVSRSHGSRSEWLTYRDGDVELNQRADLFGELRAALPGHDGYFCPTARGELHDGQGLQPQEFGLATFVRSTVPVIGSALEFVHGAFSPHSFGDHPRSRNAHAIRVFDYPTGKTLTVVQLHGLREEDGKSDSPTRDAQTDALVALIGRVAHPEDALVVCGDLNVLPDSRLFSTLGRLGLVDLVTTRGFTDTRTSHYRKGNRFADYLLVSTGTPVADFQVVEQPEVSDHRPLLLTVT